MSHMVNDGWSKGQTLIVQYKDNQAIKKQTPKQTDAYESANYVK